MNTRGSGSMKKIFWIILCLIVSTTITYAKDFPVDVTAENVAVIDLDDNKIILEKNADDKVVLASLTKMFTAYTIINHVDNLNQRIEITEEDIFALWGFTQIGLEEGDKLTYLDLLYAMMLYSAADASQALANAYSNNKIDDFMKVVNQDVQNLGLKQTVLKDTFGRDDGDISTARELATFLRIALQNKTFKQIFTTTQKRLSNGKEAVNYTKSIATFYGLDANKLIGNKPGYTEVAGLLLASYVKINGINYGIIVCKSKENENLTTHVLDTYKIIDYLEDHPFKEKTVLRKGDLLKKIKVENSTIDEYAVAVTKDIVLYLTDDEYKNLEYDYHIVDSITPDNVMGDNLGYLDIISNGKVLATYNVHLGDDIFVPEEKSRIMIIVIVGLIVFIICMMAANLFANKKNN